MIVKTFATSLICLALLGGCYTSSAIAQVISEAEIDEYLGFYDSLAAQKKRGSSATIGSSTSSYRVLTATPDSWGNNFQSVNGVSSFSNGYGTFGGYGTYPAQFSSGYGFAPANPFSIQTYESGDRLRTDPSGGIGGTILRTPTPAISAPPVILLQGGGGQGGGGASMRRGPAIPIDTQSMSMLEKRELAAKYSDKVKAMMMELDSSKKELESTMSTLAPADLTEKQGQIGSLQARLDQRVEELTAVISQFSNQPMQTQGIGSIAPRYPLGRPTAVEGSNFYFDIR